MALLQLLPSFLQPRNAAQEELQAQLQRQQARIEALEQERQGLFSLPAENFSGLALKFSMALGDAGAVELDHASSNVAALLGATPAALARDPQLALARMAARDARRIKRNWQVSCKHLQPFSQLVCLTGRSGDCWLQVQVMPQRRGNRLVWECVALDVTALQQAREAQERAHRAQLMFLSGLNARLRTPLNAIAGYVQLMEQRVDDAELGHIHHGCDQLTEILDEVLDGAALALGNLQLNPGELSLAPWLQSLARTWQHQAADRALAFSLALDNCDHTVLTDRKRLGQVLGRLFSFSIATARPGEVGVAVACQHKAGRLHATVAITLSTAAASGFSLATVAALANLDDTDLSSPLAWAQRMARQLGGSVGTVLDEQGSLSLRLRISLPLAQPVEVADAVPVVGAVNTLNILVVDDSVTNRVILTRFLQSQGHAVREADSGLTALGVLGNWTPDLVFMDIDMPGMDGCEATSCIRTLRGPSSAVTICAMTGLSFDEDRERALASGMNHFITKPVNFKEVQRMCSLVTSNTKKDAADVC